MTMTFVTALPGVNFDELNTLNKNWHAQKADTQMPAFHHAKMNEIVFQTTTAN